MSLLIEEMKSRLTQALNDRNMKPIELAEKTKIPKSSISQYMSGYAKPKSDRIYLIAKALNVSEAWLMGCDVPMERTTPKKGQLDNEPPLTEKQKFAFRLLLRVANEKNLDRLIDFLQLLIQAENQ